MRTKRLSLLAVSALLVVIAAALVTIFIVGRQTNGRGEAGMWELANPGEVSTSSTSVDILVTRLECASGVTGEILKPTVSYENDRLVIRADVARTPSAAANCQGNNQVPATVTLKEPIGQRALVDFQCVDGEAVNYPVCDLLEKWMP
ncbi:hypothetical protein [Timonella senegalensis]|uniref:hypothetical protein n=2 Tax=Timonella senegalensis TaxID=1465825 RepID=UPI002FE40F41